MSDPSAYPLEWPPGWPRTAAHGRSAWPKCPPLQACLRETQAQLRLLGATRVVLSSNVTLGNDRPSDPGVVAYATYDRLPIAIPCDRWNTVAGNVRAIGKTIEAMRGMERWGAKHMIRAMFQGFVALPAPVDWRTELGIQAGEALTFADIEARYRALAQERHPDRPGGSTERMAALNAAMDAARAYYAQAAGRSR
jgi:hypothetical protein